jgi:hypothetical protein
MHATTEHEILDDLLAPIGECWTPEVAARIAALRATPKLQRRLDKLAEKNSQGNLTPPEEAEYAAYVEALDVVAILQAKARKSLKTVVRAK